MCKASHLQASRQCAVNIKLRNRSRSLFRIGASRSGAVLICSLPLNGRKMPANDVIDTFDTRAGLGHGVTGGDCQAQHGGDHDRLFATFKRRFLTKSDHKPTGKTAFSPFFLSCHYAGDAFSLEVPPKGGWGCLMSPPCLESQGCHLIPLCYLLSCSSA